MSEQTKLEVAIPLELALSRLMKRQFRTHVRTLMRQNGGESISGSNEGNGSYYMHGSFPSRDDAINCVMVIRSLSLEHASKLAKSFWYTIDDDEMLMFNKKDDANAFESQSFAGEVNKQLGRDLSELLSGLTAF